MIINLQDKYAAGETLIQTTHTYTYPYTHIHMKQNTFMQTFISGQSMIWP